MKAFSVTMAASAVILATSLVAEIGSAQSQDDLMASDTMVAASTQSTAAYSAQMSSPQSISGSYASSAYSGDSCTLNYPSKLTHIDSIDTVLSTLRDYQSKANTKFMSEGQQNSDGSSYGMSNFAVVQCGIAIGFAKTGRLDERSVMNCDCAASKLKL